MCGRSNTSQSLTNVSVLDPYCRLGLNTNFSLTYHIVNRSDSHETHSNWSRCWVTRVSQFTTMKLEVIVIYQ